MEGAAGAPGESGTVEEDAGVVGEPGHEGRLALVVGVAAADRALLARLRVVLHVLGSYPCEPAGDVGCVGAIDEVGAEAATPLHRFGRGFVEDSHASTSVDAGEVRSQERRVEDPGPMLVGIIETDPFVQIFGNGHGAAN